MVMYARKEYTNCATIDSLPMQHYSLQKQPRGLVQASGNGSLRPVRTL